MNEVLKIEVQAQVQQAVAALKNVQTQLKATDAAAASTAKTLPKLGQSSNQATFALTNFSRVVQDAPFGIIGIANNIDPLIQSFTALKQSTGSTGAALKALAGGLIGGGGLALAISAVTSAFTFFALRQRSVNKEVSEGKSLTDSYVNSLTKQKLEFESLVKLAKDQSQAETTRAAAIKRLNDILPDTIGKLNQQNIATAEGARITRQYIKAIEARATAELLIARISENNVKLFDNRNQTLAQNQEIENKILKARKEIQRLSAVDVGDKKTSSQAQAQTTLNFLLSEQIRIQKQGREAASSLLLENEKLRNEYERILPEEIKLNKEGKNTVENKKAELAAIEGVIIGYQENNRLIQEQINLLNQLRNAAESNEIRTTGGGQSEIQRLGGFTDISGDLANLSVLARESQKLNESLNLSDQLINSIAGEFVNLFESIGKDGKKSFEELGKAIVKTTQRILIQYAITTALKALFNSLGGGLFGAGRATQNLGLKGLLRGGDINLSILRGLG